MKNVAHICNFDNGIKLYHVSSEIREDIRPIAFQNKNKKQIDDLVNLIGAARFETYKYEINAFLEPLTSELVSELVDNDFSLWESNGLFQHEINLDENEDAINYIRITSHPEQQAFMDKHWDDWYDEHKHLNNDEFSEAKAVLKKIMAVKTGIPDKMTLEEFKIVYKDHKWCNIDYFVKLNIEKGSKKQYASYIPHLQISVNKPLTVSSVEKLAT